MVDLGLCKVSSSLGYFTLRGASCSDLNFRGFHRPVTAAKPHFQILQFVVKIKYLGTLKYDFRK